MKRAVFPLSIFVALVVGFAGSQFVSSAQAQTQASPTPVCEWDFEYKKTWEKINVNIQTWMVAQHATGRSNFFVVPVGDGFSICAW